MRTRRFRRASAGNVRLTITTFSPRSMSTTITARRMAITAPGRSRRCRLRLREEMGAMMGTTLDRMRRPALALALRVNLRPELDPLRIRHRRCRLGLLFFWRARYVDQLYCVALFTLWSGNANDLWRTADGDFILRHCGNVCHRFKRLYSIRLGSYRSTLCRMRYTRITRTGGGEQVALTSFWCRKSGGQGEVVLMCRRP